MTLPLPSLTGTVREHRTSFTEIAELSLAETVAAHQRCLPPLVPAIAELAECMTAVLSTGGKVVWLGNGGSAAQAQHASAELVGRFELERAPFASLSITTDTSILTAVGNDYGYQEVFARQVQALVRTGDLVIGLSTSGQSPSVLRGLEVARAVGAFTAGLCGAEAGQMCNLCDHLVVVAAPRTAYVQEAHQIILHLLCGLVEKAISLGMIRDDLT